MWDFFLLRIGMLIMIRLLQLLQHLHSENKLSNRFPIGLEEQIQKWDPDKIRRFHERWYYPANATLYLVGEIDDIPRAMREIEVIRNYILGFLKMLAASRTI